MLWIQRLFVFLISGTIVNVWLFRSGQATLYRGGAAANLREEFMAYGLNDTLFYLVGGLKLLAAVALLLGLVWKKTLLPAAYLIALLMIGALAMHFKVADPLLRSLPAATMLLLCYGVIQLEKKQG